ncbi:DEAD/DEAH box helicase [Acidovorax temperans]|uniref:DEAD/DEAH box helicase n=1 Tax=Acidovorax temperans TaxID=80878 RepID=UPI0030CBA1FF
MSDTNPIAFAQDLKSVIARYIATTLPISRRYSKLGREFRELLSQERLVQGPYVEALPDFEKGKTISQLLKKQGGFLHDGLGLLPNPHRPLHLHQEKALRHAIVDEESFLTATGTGSGKTETFLYPIAHDLLADPEPNRPGVRALLVYPMNALANDQLYYRVAPLFARYLKDYGITFGRYTGQVKSTAKREEEEARIWNNPKLMDALGHPTSIPKNWLLTREEMLADPPKVLITNYAMLEHMLLLPRNAGLFATNSLRFIVLDEIHTYHGAQATEVAYLLRKLKTRLGVEQGIRVIGTSASLSDSETADTDLMRFASDLVGEPVERVVRGRRIAHMALTLSKDANFSMSPVQWIALGGLLREFLQLDRDDQTVDCWNRFVGGQEDLPRSLVLKGNPESPASEALVETLASNSQVRRVAEILEAGRVVDFAHLAQQVFDSYEIAPHEAQSALSTVIQSGMVARRAQGDFPLLPGRYHLAVNSIEGIVARPDASEEGWAKVRVGRSFKDEEGHYYPLMTCRKCGQPFLEGWKDQSHVHPHRPDTGENGAERLVFWLGTPFVGTEDEEDEGGEGSEGSAAHERIFVQLKTGLISATEDAVPLYPVHTEQDDVERARYVKRCPACGGRSTGADAEVITRMHPGNEALGAVVAQRVLEALPPGIIDHSDPRPSFGRNLLTFSDNRQDAAFFAPYFERTSANVALRAAVQAVLAESSSPVGITQLAERVFEYWRRNGGQPLLLNEAGEIRTDKQDVSQLLLGALGYEFCTPGGRRNSLESLGVALVTYDEAKLKNLYQQVKAFWPKHLPADQEAVDALCHILLETVRRERALESLSGLAMSDQSVWGDYNQHRTFDIEGADPGVRFKWLPGQQANRHNRRSWYLVERLGLSKPEAADFLRHFWAAITRPPATILKRFPPGFGMDGALIRIRSGLHAPLYQCKSCGLLQRHVLANKCTAFGCRGDVLMLDGDERERLGRENHYLASYAETNHLTLRAREHTASLSTELREEIEREFAERRINLLSCTTTMEMGVDLGDLEAVVNLNVPPGIANYQQRTGRAGRRAQAAPFCVTVARSTNYDQAVFRDLRGYLETSPTTPFINLGNVELFLRHQMSVVLSHFMRHALSKTDVNAPSLKHLFGDVLNEPAKTAFHDKLNSWMESEAGRSALAEAECLGDKLPPDLASLVRRGTYLKSTLIGRLKEFAEDVSERCKSYVAKKTAASETDDLKKALYWKEQLEKYMDQFLVNELSRRGLIPTYSFPVHSLTLEVQNGSTFNRFQNQSEVSLNRDASLGISEYAPGAEVVANGRIWESAGLASYPKAFMPTRWYAACPECFHVDVADSHQDIPDGCSNCGFTEVSRRKRMFIEPKGFVTSVADSKGKDPGTSRRRVKPADEARLIAAPRPESFQETELPFMQTALLLARGSEDSELRGSLFVTNRGTYGEGYYRCLFCNFCQPASAKKHKAGGKKIAAKSDAATRKFVHKDPSSGLTCKSDFMPKMGIDFAHTFNTDVRLIRFLAPLPEAPEDVTDERRFQEHVARTVAEACRMAASDMLHLFPGELRSTYRLYSNAGCIVEVVLYDGVPGGAGYSARLGTPQFSFRELVAGALRRLECPEECDSACRACLCDYGNQRHWDSFRRKDALHWLRELLEGKVAPDGPGNYVPWPKPSLAGLTERLAPWPSISFIATSLSGASGYQEAELNQLFAWLQSGKELRLYLVNKLAQQPTDYQSLMLYRHLYPWLQSGKLRIFALPELEGRLAGQLPRAFVSLDDGAVMVRQSFPIQAMLDGLVRAPAELGAMDAGTRELLHAPLSEAMPYAPEHFAEGQKMGMWEFPVGAPRRLDEVFVALKGLHIKSLAVRDPYCGTERNRPRLKQVLSFLKGHVGELYRADVYCSEVKERQRDGTDYIANRIEVAYQVERVLSDLGIEKGDAFVKELGGNRSFHDRELTFDVVDESGCGSTHRYFLTGGIDYLLDERSDTRVFHAVVTN